MKISYSGLVLEPRASTVQTNHRIIYDRACAGHRHAGLASDYGILGAMLEIEPAASQHETGGRRLTVDRNGHEIHEIRTALLKMDAALEARA